MTIGATHVYTCSQQLFPWHSQTGNLPEGPCGWMAKQTGYIHTMELGILFSNKKERTTDTRKRKICRAGKASLTSLCTIWFHLYNILFFSNKFILFIYLFLAALSLHCCARAFSSLWWAGATLCCGVRASHCGVFCCCRARALGARASVVVVHGLSSCGSRALEHRFSSCGAWA